MGEIGSGGNHAEAQEHRNGHDRGGRGGDQCATGERGGGRHERRALGWRRSGRPRQRRRPRPHLAATRSSSRCSLAAVADISWVAAGLSAAIFTAGGGGARGGGGGPPPAAPRPGRRGRPPPEGRPSGGPWGGGPAAG